MKTPKARALGRALREAREGSGLSLRSLARTLERDPGVLSRWETGDRTPRPDQVAQILTHLGVNGDRYEEIIDLCRATDAPQWLAVTLPEQRQQFAALLDLEETARTITHVGPLLIPGLLQTAPYIRAIMTGGTVPAGEVAARVAVRVGRRDVVTRANPVQVVALTGEAALRQLIGSREVMAEQLRYLREMADRANVDVRVVPFDSGWHPALEGPFIMIEPDRGVPVVQLENRRSLLFLHEDDDVSPYREATGMVLDKALSPSESVQLISEYIDRWETTG